LNKTINILEFKVDPILVLVFSFLTCDLYLISWKIKTAEVLNAVAEKRNYINPIGYCFRLLFTCLYIVGKDVLPKVYQIIGELKKDQSTLLIVLGFFFSIASAMIVQGSFSSLISYS